MKQKGRIQTEPGSKLKSRVKC